ncbi:amino acid deaminase [Phytoactinopolyspora mesophila]|uniref:Amino acid deaminase n=1 Tax=Phytoactinopolyspora mesophila TaxID=2650750 RepID=A0A7K3M6E0_9ACTN|nr:amino acid deaminase [Phytoactinopolyspora mesophila]NDL58836.1 amino acid deaminase [Phytoactinopolyspora mesophila]
MGVTIPAVEATDTWTIDWRCKSFPPSAEGMPAADVPSAGWRLPSDFTTPVAALTESALAHNLALMQQYCGNHGVRIAPHGKTTMSPELIARQLEHGAWAMTAATPWQARAMLGFGARRVIIANECLDPVGLRWVAESMRADPDVEIFVFADSVAAVESMRQVLSECSSGRPVPVLVEMGVPGGRAGARDTAVAVEVGRAVAAAPELELAGVAGFEGVIGSRRVPDVVAPVREFLGTIREAAEQLMSAEAFPAHRPAILSAGGSAFFDQVVEVFTADRHRYPRPVEVVIRSGCYITHDHGAYREVSPFAGDAAHDFRPALHVWSRVLSTPEPGLAIVDAGKRDISTDGRMPVPLSRMRGDSLAALSGVVVDHFNDQHGFLHTAAAPEGELQVGDLVIMGVSHPCTTFDKWRAIPVVDDDHRVVSAIRTYF